MIDAIRDDLERLESELDELMWVQFDNIVDEAVWCCSVSARQDELAELRKLEAAA